MRRILVAAAALIAAAAVSGGLLLATAGAGAGADFYVLSRDLPAGAPVTLDALRVTHLVLGDASGGAIGPARQRLLEHALAAHDLRAGQLLEQADLATAGGPVADRRAVLVSVKDVPGAAAGSRVDLLAVTGTPDRPSVTPVAGGLEVKAVVPGGLVVLVPARQAAALVYVAATLRVVAVVADPGSIGGGEATITNVDQALEALRR